MNWRPQLFGQDLPLPTIATRHDPVFHRVFALLSVSERIHGINTSNNRAFEEITVCDHWLKIQHGDDFELGVLIIGVHSKYP